MRVHGLFLGAVLLAGCEIRMKDRPKEEPTRSELDTTEYLPSDVHFLPVEAEGDHYRYLHPVRVKGEEQGEFLLHDEFRHCDVRAKEYIKSRRATPADLQKNADVFMPEPPRALEPGVTKQEWNSIRWIQAHLREEVEPWVYTTHELPNPALHASNARVFVERVRCKPARETPIVKKVEWSPPKTPWDWEDYLPKETWLAYQDGQGWIPAKMKAPPTADPHGSALFVDLRTDGGEFYSKLFAWTRPARREELRRLVCIFVASDNWMYDDWVVGNWNRKGTNFTRTLVSNPKGHGEKEVAAPMAGGEEDSILISNVRLLLEASPNLAAILPQNDKDYMPPDVYLANPPGQGERTYVPAWMKSTPASDGTATFQDVRNDSEFTSKRFFKSRPAERADIAKGAIVYVGGDYFWCKDDVLKKWTGTGQDFGEVTVSDTSAIDKGLFRGVGSSDAKEFHLSNARVPVK